MRIRLSNIGVLTLLIAWPAIALAQVAAKPAASPAAPAAVTPAPTPPPVDPYSYAPDGRRDPFVSLVSRGVQPTVTGRSTGGLSGLTIEEVVLTGVLQSRGTFIALVKGPDGRTFNARVNDRLVDGTIRSITPQGMVFMQEVNDPLSLVKVREVRKGLRTSDDVKQ